MYIKAQLTPLLDALQGLRRSSSTEGLEQGLTVVDSNALQTLLTEARRLQDMEQRLLLGSHEHRHGTSTYLFLVPKDAPFGEDELGANLQEDFEPEEGETLSVTDMGEPVLVTAEDLGSPTPDPAG